MRAGFRPVLVRPAPTGGAYRAIALGGDYDGQQLEQNTSAGAADTCIGSGDKRVADTGVAITGVACVNKKTP